MSRTTHHFASSLRRGLTAAIDAPAAAQRAGVLVRLTVSGEKTGGGSDFTDIDQTVALYGPGDIIGFKPDVVSRVEPKANVGDFEPNYFPMLEIQDPDFLWRFTADKADGQGRLTPWVSLIVLIAEDRGDAIHREFDEGSLPMNGLPRWIRVLEPSQGLPDLEEAWRWAHLEGVGNEEGITLSRSGASIKDDLIAAVSDAPDQMLCRLMAARRLKAGTLYSALVVPTFELGRLAGLGLEAGDSVDAHAKSWTAGQAYAEGLRLPYYFRWEFRTGQRGDFERLVRLLEPRNEIPGLGERAMDCATPGFGVSPVRVERPGETPDHDAVLGLEGALRPVDLAPTAWGLDAGVPFNDFRQELADKLLNLPKLFPLPQDIVFTPQEIAPIRNVRLRPRADYLSGWIEWDSDVALTSQAEFWIDGQEATVLGDATPKIEHSLLIRGLEPGSIYVFKVAGIDAGGVRVETPEGQIKVPALPSVTPPSYGRWHAARLLVDTGAATWFHELNLDPRHRAASGFGSEVVRKQQEPLMASAWEQLGPIEKANNLLRQAQLGRGGSNILWNRLGMLETDGFLQVTAAVHPRTRPIDGAGTVAAESAFVALGNGTRLPRGVLSPAFRRIAGLRSPLRKRQRDSNGQMPAAGGRDTVQRLALGSLEVVGPPPTPEGMPSICDISMALEKTAAESPPDAGGQPIDLSGDGGLTAPIGVSTVSPSNLTPITGTGMTTAIGEVTVAAPGAGVTVAQPTSTTGTGTPTAAGDVTVAAPEGGSTGFFTNTVNLFRRIFEIVRNVILAIARFLGIVNDPSSAGPVEEKPEPVRFCDDEFQCLYLYEEMKKGAFDGIESKVSSDFVLNAVCPALDHWLQLQPKELQTPSPDEQFILDLREGILRALHPKRTIPKRVQARVRLLGEHGAREDNLDTIMWAPTFPQPMYEPLRDVSQDFILPGVQNVPQNTVALVKTNRRFMESYIVGLNHEFASELLWRQFPTDQRGSYFRQFWDVSDRVPTAADLLLDEDDREEKYRDIEKVHLWSDSGALTELGDNPPEGASGEAMVLLIRGDLLKKYPNTVIYAVRAIDRTADMPDDQTIPAPAKVPDLEEFTGLVPADPKKMFPIFRGELPPDLTFFGFDFNETEAREHFFVIEERVADARFGLDMPAGEARPVVQDADDLGWGHFETDAERDARLGQNGGGAGARADGWYLDGRFPQLVAGDDLNYPWGNDNQSTPTSAQIAVMTKQSPVRVAISARMLLPD